jgi:hypothetical protein
LATECGSLQTPDNDDDDDHHHPYVIAAKHIGQKLYNFESIHWLISNAFLTRNHVDPKNEPPLITQQLKSPDPCHP